MTKEIQIYQEPAYGFNKNGEYNRIIGNSLFMQEVYRIIYRIADMSITALITGETGTGKELVAKALHFNSRRQKNPFVAVNCAGIPTELLESELFGYMRGAFTGAHKDTPGYFEAANDGTIFLDEIGDMPLALQVKILRIIEDKNFSRIGSRKTQTLDARVIAATNKELEVEIEKGNFRRDLYYRLNKIDIKMPPLRERGYDIDRLANYFSKMYSQEYYQDPGKFILDDDAAKLLRSHHWPGNVRELENTMERSIVIHPYGLDITDKVILTEDYLWQFLSKPKTTSEPVNPTFPRLKREESELRLIIETINRCGGNKSKAALALGITRESLYGKLKKLE